MIYVGEKKNSRGKRGKVHDNAQPNKEITQFWSVHLENSLATERVQVDHASLTVIYARAHRARKSASLLPRYFGIMVLDRKTRTDFVDTTACVVRKYGNCVANRLFLCGDETGDLDTQKARDGHLGHLF